VQVEIDLPLTGARTAAAFDVNDVRPIEDGHVDRVARLVAQLLEVRGADLAELHRVDRREAEVEDSRPEPVLLRRRVLLEVAEHRERRDVPVRRASTEADFPPEVTHTEQWPARAEGGEDREPTLERLRVGTFRRRGE